MLWARSPSDAGAPHASVESLPVARNEHQMGSGGMRDERVEHAGADAARRTGEKDCGSNDVSFCHDWRVDDVMI